MNPQKNYIDARGNYHNVENLTLTQIHDRASEEGYRLGKAEAIESEDNAIAYTKGYQDGFLEAKKLFTDPDSAVILEKATAEIISILKDIMPQVVEIAKEHATGNVMKEGQPHE